MDSRNFIAAAYQFADVAIARGRAGRTRVYACVTMTRKKSGRDGLTELGLIEQIRSGWGRGASVTGLGAGRRAGARGAARNVVLGIGDDCAILRPPRGHEVLVTTDFSLEGRHFRRDLHPPESVGHRALARGLSDVAAMGGRPMAAFLSLALPGEMLGTRAGREWVRRFFAGLRGLAERAGVELAGGDTAESPDGLVLADIVLVGSAALGRALRRSGGRVGDGLYVTGELGGAAAELEEMERVGRRGGRQPGFGAHPQMYPEPRIGVGLALVRRGLATAAIDLSDGLSTDLGHLCRESGVGAEVLADALPVHLLAAGAEGGQQRALELALHGGEDYELLFAAPAEARVPRSIGGVRVTRIGQLVRGSGVMLVDSGGRRRALKPGGWEHFTGRH
jgi:thiamine-monophosphate kinase